MLLLRSLASLLALFAALDSVPELAAEPPVTLPVLMYHEVKNERLGKDVITPAEFESDLRFLAENEYTPIVIQELLAYVYEGASLPEKPIILSFDDGYLSNYRYVLPLLKAYNMKIVLSIIGRSTDEFTQHPDDDLDYTHVSWDQLREMLASGLVEVQNHTYNMHKYGNARKGCCQMAGEPDGLYERRLRADVEKLQESLYTETGRVPIAFAYPYGLYDPDTEAILADMGFLSTFTCEFGVNRITRDPDCLYGLKRICRTHGRTAAALLAEAEKAQKYAETR